MPLSFISLMALSRPPTPLPAKLCISGAIDHPGVYEVEFGTSLRELLDFAGGAPIISGTSLPASDIHTTEVADAWKTGLEAHEQSNTALISNVADEIL